MKRKTTRDARAPRKRREAEKNWGRAQELALTTPDLVLLSLLAERPMHGIPGESGAGAAGNPGLAGFRGRRFTTRWNNGAGGMIRASESDEPAAGRNAARLRRQRRASAALGECRWSSKNGRCSGNAAVSPRGCALLAGAAGRHRKTSFQRREEFSEAGGLRGKRKRSRAVLERSGIVIMRPCG